MMSGLPEYVVNVEVFAPEGVSPSFTDALKGTVAPYLSDLVRDFDLPGQVRLECVPADRDNSLAAASVRVSINRIRCRTNRQCWHACEASAQTLAHAVVEDVFANRGLLLSEEVLSNLVENAGMSARRIPSADAGTAAREAIQLGFAPSKVLSALRRFDQDQPAEMLLEEAFAAAFEPGIVVHASPDAYSLFEEKLLRERFGNDVDDMARPGLFYELGLVFGKVEPQADPKLPGNVCRFQLNGVRRPPFTGLGRSQYLVNETPERLRLLRLDAIARENPTTRSEAAVVEGDLARRICAEGGLTSWDRREQLFLALVSEIRRSAAGLLTLNQLEYHLAALSLFYPKLVKVTRETIPIARLCRVLRGLVGEGVGIRNSRRILQALIDLHLDCREPGVERSIEHVRGAISAQLCAAVAKDNQIICVLLEPELEDRLRAAGEAAWTPSANETEQLLTAIARELGSVDSTVLRVVLTDRAIRQEVRRLTAVEFPRLAVLSYNEMCPEYDLQPIGLVKIDGGPR